MEILHQTELRKARETGEPQAIRTAEEAYRRDRIQLENEMETKVSAVRGRGDKNRPCR